MYVTSIIRNFHFIVVFDNIHSRALGALSLLKIFSLVAKYFSGTEQKYLATYYPNRMRSLHLHI